MTNHLIARLDDLQVRYERMEKKLDAALSQTPDAENGEKR
jgi:hypothetical protein